VSYTPKFVTGCPDCGVSVFLYEGKHYAPLREYLLTGQIIGNDTDIQFRRAYIEHQCLPEDLDRHSQVTEDVVGALKALIEDNPPEWLQGDLQRASKTAKSKYAKLQEITHETDSVDHAPAAMSMSGDLVKTSANENAEIPSQRRTRTKNVYLFPAPSKRLSWILPVKKPLKPMDCSIKSRKHSRRIMPWKNFCTSQSSADTRKRNRDSRQKIRRRTIEAQKEPVCFVPVPAKCAFWYLG
jgi:predicted  nucleic acid-binding Zn-ribbon protein